MNKGIIQRKIGRIIKEKRMELDLTQEDLAKSIGKQRPAIQRLESGTVNPSIYFLHEVAGGLKITLEELLKELK
jgi:transcriptional regulator with XRE-family HTH domain